MANFEVFHWNISSSINLLFLMSVCTCIYFEFLFNFLIFQKLNDIMKVELLEEKSKEEIVSLWTQHFASKHVVCAVCIFLNSQYTI